MAGLYIHRFVQTADYLGRLHPRMRVSGLDDFLTFGAAACEGATVSEGDFAKSLLARIEGCMPDLSTDDDIPGWGFMFLNFMAALSGAVELARTPHFETALRFLDQTEVVICSYLEGIWDVCPDGHLLLLAELRWFQSVLEGAEKGTSPSPGAFLLSVPP
ncbi:MAG: hypothetical protein ACO1TE_07360 [Prosthecobacter sp.]